MQHYFEVVNIERQDLGCVMPKDVVKGTNFSGAISLDIRSRIYHTTYQYVLRLSCDIMYQIKLMNTY